MRKSNACQRNAWGRKQKRRLVNAGSASFWRGFQISKELNQELDRLSTHFLYAIMVSRVSNCCLSQTWREVWQLDPDRSRWSAWSHGWHKTRNCVPQRNAKLENTSCQTPSWCRLQCPSQWNTFPLLESKYQLHPVACLPLIISSYLQPYRHAWSLPYDLPSFFDIYYNFQYWSIKYSWYRSVYWGFTCII